ncbi:MAG: DUF2341 domain-containing protein [Candidatus Aenigmatarchaeota archaeon]
MRSDCGDIRFTDSDGITLLNYWIEPNTCNTNNTRIWVKVPNIPANSQKIIYLYYGNPNANSQQDFSLITPNYIGTEFYSTCLNVSTGNGTAFRIVSYEDGNTITIYRSDTWQLVQTIALNKFQSTSYTCNSDYPYYIKSTKPISLTYDDIGPDHDSDDDVTSIYGNKIWIRVPRHLWICSYDNNNFVRVQNSNLQDVYSGTLNEGQCWYSGSLTPGFYYINATYDVTAQFGLEDDSIYTIIYGRTYPNGTQIYYFYSHGYTIVSALYPNTNVIIDNLEGTTGDWSGILANEGDYIRTQQITSFSSNAPEYVRMKVVANKPVLVYTEGNYYNYGSEQIPSINGKGAGTYFVFRVGRGSRYVRIIGTEDNTVFNISGAITYTNVAINKGQQLEYSVTTSWGLIRIASNKPILVFERGYYTSESISIVLPFKYSSPEPTISLQTEETSPIIKLTIINLGIDLGKKLQLKLIYEDNKTETRNINLNETFKLGDFLEIPLKDLPKGKIKKIEVYCLDVCPGLLVGIKSVNIEV